MPYKIIQTLYYDAWKESLSMAAKNKAMEEELEDNIEDMHR
jgi:hypothetical protein